MRPLEPFEVSPRDQTAIDDMERKVEEAVFNARHTHLTRMVFPSWWDDEFRAKTLASMSSTQRAEFKQRVAEQLIKLRAEKLAEEDGG